ncbi:S41 family peptidase [soil metagenome]
MPLLFAIAALSMARPLADDFPKLWEDVSKAISTNYYARKTRKDDMDRLFAKYKPIASAAKTREEFEKAVNDMMAEFKDSHFSFLGMDQQGYYLMDGLTKKDKAAPMPNIGAWFRQSPDGYTVQMVLNGSSAEKVDLHKGDKIEMADGKTFSPVDSFAASTSVKLSILREGKKLEKQVDVSKTNALGMFLDATRNSVRIIDSGTKKIGYIHLWTQAGDEFKNAVANAVYGKLKDTDACILDLRDGFGGRPEGYADPFFRPDVKLEWNTPYGTNSQLFGNQRPLVVLINAGSRSAKEVLSEIFKISKRATLVGSTTAGNVLGTFPQRISDWAYIEIPSTDLTVNGIRLEGVGVPPDVTVAKEFDEKGNDLYIAKALEVLK